MGRFSETLLRRLSICFSEFFNFATSKIPRRFLICILAIFLPSPAPSLFLVCFLLRRFSGLFPGLLSNPLFKFIVQTPSLLSSSRFLLPIFFFYISILFHSIQAPCLFL